VYGHTSKTVAFTGFGKSRGLGKSKSFIYRSWSGFTRDVNTKDAPITASLAYYEITRGTATRCFTGTVENTPNDMDFVLLVASFGAGQSRLISVPVTVQTARLSLKKKSMTMSLIMAMAYSFVRQVCCYLIFPHAIVEPAEPLRRAPQAAK
jgi:hypothetical protein